MAEIKTFHPANQGKVDVIDFQETNVTHFSHPNHYFISLLSTGFDCTCTLRPKPNPLCDYHMRLWPPYQNGADLSFVVVND